MHWLKSLVPAGAKRILLAIEAIGYRTTLAALVPINSALARVLAGRVRPGTVLHVSAMVHVPYYMVRILREHGVKADYLAVGPSPWWDQADYHFRPTRWPLASVLKEMWWVWKVVSRYQIVHSHFMVTVTRTGWEWPLLRRMGRHIVVHYRGCEIRNRESNQQLHPDMNICQECDYDPRPCATPLNEHRRRLAAEYGSAFLVTTPDMKDFAPEARHIPFFVMQPERVAAPSIARAARAFKIVHATNHPGIEGSRHIRRAVESLRAKGYDITYVELTGVTHERVMQELTDADLSIGKLKMGYYANLQIESMAAGVPTITHVRPEFITGELRDSGFIFATLETLEQVLEHYLSNPVALQEKRALARQSILALHDQAAIARQYIDLYAGLLSGGTSPGR
ncbi:MAG: hypothetical protein Q7R30_16160 [Acidobacteriota bacterium]|nr:hypothetical protein [Acidobacteriota bacterium]